MTGTFTNTVQATSGRIKATGTVTVTPGPLATIVVTPNPVTLNRGRDAAVHRGRQGCERQRRRDHAGMVGGCRRRTINAGGPVHRRLNARHVHQHDQGDERRHLRHRDGHRTAGPIWPRSPSRRIRRTLPPARRSSSRRSGRMPAATSSRSRRPGPSWPAAARSTLRPVSSPPDQSPARSRTPCGRPSDPLSGSATVTVTAGGATTITVTPNPAALQPGGTQQIARRLLTRCNRYPRCYHRRVVGRQRRRHHQRHRVVHRGHNGRQFHEYRAGGAGGLTVTATVTVAAAPSFRSCPRSRSCRTRQS